MSDSVGVVNGTGDVRGNIDSDRIKVISDRTMTFGAEQVTGAARNTYQVTHTCTRPRGTSGTRVPRVICFLYTYRAACTQYMLNVLSVHT